MSVEFCWEKFSGEQNAQAAMDFLNGYFAALTDLPDFIGPVRVTRLELGDVPPEIEIIDICDPLERFEVNDEELWREIEKDQLSRLEERREAQRASREEKEQQRLLSMKMNQSGTSFSRGGRNGPQSLQTSSTRLSENATPRPTSSLQALNVSAIESPSISTVPKKKPIGKGTREVKEGRVDDQANEEGGYGSWSLTESGQGAPSMGDNADRVILLRSPSISSTDEQGNNSALSGNNASGRVGGLKDLPNILSLGGSVGPEQRFVMGSESNTNSSFSSISSVHHHLKEDSGRVGETMLHYSVGEKGNAPKFDASNVGNRNKKVLNASLCARRGDALTVHSQLCENEGTAACVKGKGEVSGGVYSAGKEKIIREYLNGGAAREDADFFTQDSSDCEFVVEKEERLQINARVAYAGDACITIETELFVNWPCPKFISLPIVVTVSNFEMNNVAAVVYSQFDLRAPCLADDGVADDGEYDRNYDEGGFENEERHCQGERNTHGRFYPQGQSTFAASRDDEEEPYDEDTGHTEAIKKKFVSFCFLSSSNDGEAPELSMRISSEVGDRSRQSLRNVDKIEHFIVEELRKIVQTHLHYPKYCTVCV
eukprot:Nk52_evm32s151 gene=Nk52_evmTU32s151